MLIKILFFRSKLTTEEVLNALVPKFTPVLVALILTVLLYILAFVEATSIPLIAFAKFAADALKSPIILL